MKYKVGDKVRVRRDLVVGNSYTMEDGDRNSYIADMKDVAEANDYVLTINYEDGQYTVEEDKLGYSWTDGMFEGLVTNTEKFESCNTELTDREKFKGWMRKLSSLNDWDKTWNAFNNLTVLKPDDDVYKGQLKIVTDYLFGVEKKKMTKAQIEAELGYEIEIVEE